MKKKYYELLQKYKINDLLSNVDLPYSNKYLLIQGLLLTSHENTEVVNHTLNDYYVNYIQTKRYSFLTIESILYGICKKYLKEKEKC